MSFFLLASKATKYKASMKEKLEDDFKEGKIYCFMLYINMELYPWLLLMPVKKMT
jgi:hypothetical protein